MNNKKLYNIYQDKVPLFLLLLTCIPGHTSYRIPTELHWLIIIILLYNFWKYVRYSKIELFSPQYKYITYFYIWALFGAIRGIFEAENYYDWRNLIIGFFGMSVVLCSYYYSNPDNIKRSMIVWFRYAIPIFVLFFSWMLPIDAYHYYLAPIYVFGIFTPLLETKWKWIMSLLMLLTLFGDIFARTQVLTTLASVCLALFLKFFKKKPLFMESILKKVRLLFLITPILLAILGISGQFNVFSTSQDNFGGKNTKETSIGSNTVTDDVAGDTRTLLYVEVIKSAIDNNYYLFGRTLARGNDTSINAFIETWYELTNRYERYANEVGMLNIFTWLGLVGVLLYSLIFIIASYEGLYHSNNIYVKLLACLLSFHFLLSFIEDYPGFNIHTIAIWIIISMVISQEFRHMNDEQFRLWFKEIFN